MTQYLSCWFEERADDCRPTRDLSSADPSAPLADVVSLLQAVHSQATVPVGVSVQ
jgi:hypothetical protein